MARSNPSGFGVVWTLVIAAALMFAAARFTSAVPQTGVDEGAAPPREISPPIAAPEPARAVPGGEVSRPISAPEPPRPAPGATPSNAIRTALTEQQVKVPFNPNPKLGPVATKAIGRAEGTAAPGLQVRLNGADSQGSDLRFRWVQTRGPVVRLDDPSRSVVKFTVPAEIGPLGFLLVVSGPDGSDTTDVNVPIEGVSRAAENPSLQADAGDDQLGLVGRQVTLNGVRSEPRGRLGYRWVQTGGPTVRFKIEDGYIFSFVPVVPGVYRFVLVVASGSEISIPNEVSVTVGSGTRTAGPSGPAPTASIPAEAPVPTQEVARASLASVRGGAAAAEPLARVFDDTADRMDLYRSYADAFSEMSRRFDEILPGDPGKRSIWVERLFNPLTARALEVMRGEGLDLRLPEGQTASLSASQKAALAEQFRLMAEGFRSVSHAR